MQYKKLSINDVELDFDNPRIKQYLEMYGDNITSEGIALALSASGTSNSGSSYSALKESIKVSQGIIMPIIVNKYANGRMVVIEGNTRLQIYKEFAISDPNGPWREIIAIVYDDLPDEKIHAIRLQTHLVGPRDWDPFSKAKYLNQLSNIDKLPMATIISYCGGKSSEINKLINAYNDMMQYYFPNIEKAGLDGDPRDFSKFAELQNRQIQETLLAHKYTKTDFAEWVINGNIDNAQNVRKLPAILANQLACEEFLKTNISEALKYLNVGQKGVKNLSAASMNDLVLELISRIRNISRKECKALTYDPRCNEQKNALFDLENELKELLIDLGEDVE